MRTKESVINTALLISGSGTTAEAVIRACQGGEIPRIRPVLVISSRPDAPGLACAEALDIPTAVVQRRDFASVEAFGKALLTELQKHGVGLVSQNGWLLRTPQNVIEAYPGQIINQHPGRLPAFGGKGMFGSRVTHATLAYFELTDDQNPWTASVVHHVTAAFDEGQPIQVSRLTITRPNGPEDLVFGTKRVQKQLLPIEHDNVKSVLMAFGDGEVPTAAFDDTPFQTDLLQAAKERAIQLFPNG